MVARCMALLVVKLGVEAEEHPEQLTEGVEEVPQAMSCAVPARSEQPEQQPKVLQKELVVGEVLIVCLLYTSDAADEMD